MAAEEKTAVITGASSGIGAEFARRFAERGYKLILTGRREEILRTVREEMKRRYTVLINIKIIELSDERELENFAKELEKTSDIEVLVNNAGFGLEESFIEGDVDKHLDMVKVHCEAPMRLIAAAAPIMVRRASGTIINISSLGSFFASPSSATYCASKLFLNSISESLHMELKNAGIRVIALCPGFTRTDFHEKLGIPNEELKNQGPIRWMLPPAVVDYAFRCLEKKRGKVICIPGFLNRLLYRFSKLVPRRLFYLAAAKKGIPRSKADPLE